MSRLVRILGVGVICGAAWTLGSSVAKFAEAFYDEYGVSVRSVQERELMNQRAVELSKEGVYYSAGFAGFVMSGVWGDYLISYMKKRRKMVS